MKWRALLIALHRDIGFFAVGLTLVYVVSGIAVNHREHWDYNASRSRELTQIGLPVELLNGNADGELQALTPGEAARLHQEALVERIIQVIGRDEAPGRVFWRSHDRLSLFFGHADSDVVDYRPSLGLVDHEVRRSRPLIRQMNFLHLNEARGAWTWIADAYALLLAFLAISGVLIVRGRKGVIGRGGIYLVAGLVVPVVLYFMLSS